MTIPPGEKPGVLTH
jgi:hypothetical protein